MRAKFWYAGLPLLAQIKLFLAGKPLFTGGVEAGYELPNGDTSTVTMHVRLIVI